MTILPRKRRRRRPKWPPPRNQDEHKGPDESGARLFMRETTKENISIDDERDYFEVMVSPALTNHILETRFKNIVVGPNVALGEKINTDIIRKFGNSQLRESTRICSLDSNSSSSSSSSNIFSSHRRSRNLKMKIQRNRRTHSPSACLVALGLLLVATSSGE